MSVKQADNLRVRISVDEDPELREALEAIAQEQAQIPKRWLLLRRHEEEMLPPEMIAILKGYPQDTSDRRFFYYLVPCGEYQRLSELVEACLRRVQIVNMRTRTGDDEPTAWDRKRDFDRP